MWDLADIQLSDFSVSDFFLYQPTLHIFNNRIDGVMVSKLASIAVNGGFVHRSSLTKDYEIDICFFSAKH